MRILDRGLVYDAQTAPAEGRCAAFTSLVRLGDGSLLCSFKVGPAKLSPLDNILILRSTDQGRNWHEHFRGFARGWQGTPGSFSSGYPCEIAPGRLLIALTWVDRSNPDLPLANPATAGLLPVRTLLAESDDGGATWEPLRELVMRPQRGATLTSEIVLLNGGELLLPYESWKDWDDVEGVQSANGRFSSDNGRTWSEPIVMASDPAQRRFYWDNRLAKHPDGRVAAMFWTHDPAAGVDVDVHLAWADPTGRNWSSPRPTGIAGQIAAPLAMGPETLFCVYVHRHDPPSIRAVVSRDLGQSWDRQDELVVYESGGGREAGTSGPRLKADYWEDMYRWTFGHPKAVLLDAGAVLVAYYAGAGDALSIHWARIEDV